MDGGSADLVGGREGEMDRGGGGLGESGRSKRKRVNGTTQVYL